LFAAINISPGETFRLLDSVHPETTYAGKLFLKSPFEKGGFRGIYKGLPPPPSSPLPKGGVLRSFRMETIYQLVIKTLAYCSLLTKNYPGRQIAGRFHGRGARFHDAVDDILGSSRGAGDKHAV
jgi:hypothetical protein